MSAPGSGEGAAVLAQALAAYGCRHVFGVVGVPVMECGMAFQTAGLNYIGTRNEQAASYAAAAAGYLDGMPGVCLVVSGPGVVHALAGLANAKENCWPMILIGGASDLNQSSTMAFQESPQVEFVRPYVKFACVLDSVDRIPFLVHRAVRHALSGRPGPVYLDLPGNVVNTAATAFALDDIPFDAMPSPPRSLADPQQVELAANALLLAQRPLVIVGKGIAYARAEQQMRSFIRNTQLPFLPTPMGKGVLPDSDPLNVIAARSFALKSADVVVVAGARLNWILHFGQPPRFAEGVKIIQLDVCAEAMGDNADVIATLLGDATLTLAQLSSAVLIKMKGQGAEQTESRRNWKQKLTDKVKSNAQAMAALTSDASVPMNYYHPLSLIQAILKQQRTECVIISEGANTMDIGRSILENQLPRLRVDAASCHSPSAQHLFACLCVTGLQAMAAQVVYPDRRIVCVLGDSSFGFSGMEVETLCRYGMPIVIIIINNGGIYMGMDAASTADMQSRISTTPVTSLSSASSARYELIAEAFGGKGFYVTQPHEVQPAVAAALKLNTPSIINIIINSSAGRRPQEFDWLTRKSAL